MSKTRSVESSPPRLPACQKRRRTTSHCERGDFFVNVRSEKVEGSPAKTSVRITSRDWNRGPPAQPPASPRVSARLYLTVRELSESSSRASDVPSASSISMARVSASRVAAVSSSDDRSRFERRLRHLDGGRRLGREPRHGLIGLFCLAGTHHVPELRCLGLALDRVGKRQRLKPDIPDEDGVIRAGREEARAVRV